MKVGSFETGKVYQGDCLELMKAIPDSVVRLIWTDPPYGINANDKGDLLRNWKSAMGKGDHHVPYWKAMKKVHKDEEARPVLNDSLEDATRVIEGMLKEAARVLFKDYSSLCCCCAGGGPSTTFADLAHLLDQKPFTFFHAIVWDKGSLGMGWRYRRNYEFIMVAHLKWKKLSWSWKGCGKEVGNIIKISRIVPRPHQHPTVKPVALVEHFLRLHTKPGEVVLDPFAGSGTTGVACKKMGREFIGFELDQHWVDVANKRIEETEGAGVTEEGLLYNPKYYPKNAKASSDSLF
jgi:DNA modification methylase